MDEAPKPIQIAVGRLTTISGVIIESPLEFISSEASWATQLSLKLMHSSDYVPEQTRWVVLIDASYPSGRIRIYPAKTGGLTHTFPHQERNILFESSHATWNTGKLCLDSPLQKIGRIAAGPEPKEDTEQRLSWHIKRCISWLESAAINQLMVSDEPFEVPQCPFLPDSITYTVIHDEGSNTWQAWRERLGQFGEVNWSLLPDLKNTIVADEFFDLNNTRIRRCCRHLQISDKPWIGYWWLWPSPIVIPPWYSPGTWSELRHTGEQLKVDVDGFIGWVSHQAAGKEAVIVLMGYPIPSLWNGTPEEVHWQAILLPNIPAKIKPLNGFRANDLGYRERLRHDFFYGTKKLFYLKTENWHPNRLQARGRFILDLRTCSIAIIGAGALGASVAELLARGGVTNILIIDKDTLESGNLVRHTLTCVDIGQSKAVATASRLQSAAPMSHITSYTGCLPRDRALKELLESFEIVLDCTGDDDVLHLLSDVWWSIPRYFLSSSLGFAARRLFLYGIYECTFPLEEFDSAIKPWLIQEQIQWTSTGETLEGPGCWSPLFPARCDDVWLAAVATVKHLEAFVSSKASDGLKVLEQYADRDFIGYKSVELNPDIDPHIAGVC